MRLDNNAKEYATLPITVDVDPTSATIGLRIDDAANPVAMTWVGAAVQSGSTWTRTAQIFLAGPDVASPGAATVLTTGRHLCEWVLTVGSEIIVRGDDVIVVD